MICDKKVGCLILAGGKGKRLGFEIPKQFICVKGKPMICHTIEKMLKSEYIDEIYVVAEKESKEKCHNIIEERKKYDSGYKKIKGILIGGETRQESSKNGVNFLSESTDVEIVVIHDVARMFTSKKIIDENIKGAYDNGCAVACVLPKDTIRKRDKTLKRDELFLVQTPQSFEMEIIKNGHRLAEKNGFMATDDISLVERLGAKIHITEGSYDNVKITTKEDLPLEFRVGKGYDVHRLAENIPCIIGGVEIENELGLVGHSDADVLTHAIIDGLLGAMGLGDIGMHFPDTDKQYLGISSLELLSKVVKIVRDKGFEIMNIDSTVICEKPKVLPYVPEMKRLLCRVLQIEEERINIKGTTTEKLGFTGRKEGIAAEAVCLLQI